MWVWRDLRTLTENISFGSGGQPLCSGHPFPTKKELKWKRDAPGSSRGDGLRGPAGLPVVVLLATNR